jgi:hypothetical protein
VREKVLWPERFDVDIEEFCDNITVEPEPEPETPAENCVENSFLIMKHFDITTELARKTATRADIHCLFTETYAHS